MTQKDQVLVALRVGPLRMAELETMTGIPRRSLWVILSTLRIEGFVGLHEPRRTGIRRVYSLTGLWRAYGAQS